MAERTLNDDDYQPIRALNDLLFCERRCALHRIEQVWVDNSYTLEGTRGHRRADLALRRTGDGAREVHAVWLRSDHLRLIGKADVVEFHPGPDGCEVPFPVEYKRGKRRRWDNDEVQLCAQALCLEEMLGVPVPRGAVFHLKSKRRRDVTFDAALRQLTIDTAQRLHALMAAGITPPPVYKARCRGCSLLDVCMPHALSEPARFVAYQQRLYQIAPNSDSP